MFNNFIQITMKSNSPILITGCQRSGSSMIAAVINHCGAFGGEMQQSNQSKRRGMFENVKIKETIVKPYLAKIGCDVEGQFPLANPYSLVIPTDWKERVQNILVNEKYVTGAWMYKDSRISQIWPIWSQIYPEAKYVLVRRRTGDVINSCMKTGFMGAFKNQHNLKLIGVSSEEEGWLWWVHEHEKRFVEMISAGLNCKVVWPQRMENGDFEQLYELIEWLGLKWNDTALNYIELLLGKKKGA